MGIYLRGKWYWYSKQIEGKRRFLPLRIKRGQEYLLSARTKQVEDKLTAQYFGLPVPVVGSTTFSQYVQKYLDRKKYKKSWSRDKQRLEIIQQIWPDLPLGHYGPVQVHELEQKLFARKIKPATVNRYMEILRGLWNCAIEDREAQENPIRAYKAFAEDGARRALSDDEISRILAEARHMQKHPGSSIERVIYDLILFALSTGMRLGLILTLKKEYIQGDMLVVPISQTKSKRRGVSKAIRSKTIILSKMAQDIIRKQKSDDEFVFPISWRHPNVISRVVKRLRSATGINDFSFHSFRHTASTFVSEHSSLATAREVLGHSDIKTTLKYTHPEIKEKRKSVTKLSTHLEKLSRKRLLYNR